MAKLTFSSTNIDRLSRPSTNNKAGYLLYKYEHDKSLALKVTKSGTKTFVTVYPDGSRKIIGRYGRLSDEFSLSDAKEVVKENIINYKKGLTSDEFLSNEQSRIPLFAEMAAKYITWAKKHKKPASIQSDKERLKNHILPVLGKMPVDQITSRDISTLFDSLIDKQKTYTYLKSVNGVSPKKLTQEDLNNILKDVGVNPKDNFVDVDQVRYSIKSLLRKYVGDNRAYTYLNENAEYYSVTRTTTQGTVNKCKALLSHMFNSAMRWDEPEWRSVKSNPCSLIKATRSKSKTRYLDKQGITRLNKVLGSEGYKNHMVALLIRFLLLTGARRSEAINARWKHIDFNNKVWRKPDTGSKTKLTPPVPLSDAAIRLLSEIKEISGEGYIFKSSTSPDKPLGEFRKSFNNIMKKADIENCTPHDLRRTFGSQLLLAGVDIYTVSKLLGHNSVATTERHYAFLNRETLHSAVNALDGLIG